MPMRVGSDAPPNALEIVCGSGPRVSYRTDVERVAGDRCDDRARFALVLPEWEKRAAGERAPHKSTPLRAAPYFRPDPIRGSPSRSPLADRSLTVLCDQPDFVKRAFPP